MEDKSLWASLVPMEIYSFQEVAWMENWTSSKIWSSEPNCDSELNQNQVYNC